MINEQKLSNKPPDDTRKTYLTTVRHTCDGHFHPVTLRTTSVAEMVKSGDGLGWHAHWQRDPGSWLETRICLSDKRSCL